MTDNKFNLKILFKGILINPRFKNPQFLNKWSVLHVFILCNKAEIQTATLKKSQEVESQYIRVFSIHADKKH